MANPLMHYNSKLLLKNISFANIRNPATKLEDMPLSLYPLISTPEKYAKALGLTLTEMNREKEDYEKEFRNMQASIVGLDGKAMHRTLCEYRFHHGKSPFVCPACWSYKPICICQRIEAVLASIPDQSVTAPVDVMIQVHHDEWQRPSNTGIVCARLLSNCHMLLKGYIEHDSQLEDLLADPNVFPVLLWPGKTETTDDGPPPPPVYTPEQVLQDGVANTKRTVVIVLDGTWGNARRMSQKFGQVPRLALVNETLESNWLVDARLRKIGPTGSVHSLCTAQAIVLALQGLGMSPGLGDALRELTRIKLALTTKFCGKPVLPSG